MFKVATWNVNSLRVRLPQVIDWLATEKPDVLGLQEIKMLDEDFPTQVFQELGYHTVSNGQKTYNGVALLSRHEMTDVVKAFPSREDPQRRVLAATINHIRVINLYIPNGESVISEKYTYKLNWLQHLRDFLQVESQVHPKIIVMGDFNIAPEDRDVHDPAALLEQVLCSQPERAAFQTLLDLGFQDCFRLHPQEEKSFSWWDYRVNAFKRNMGLRIDHILTNSAYASSCTKCYIDKGPRAHERPSDHAIVVAEFDE